MAGRWRGEGRWRPGARRRPGSGAKLRGGRGQLIPLLTLVGDGLWREIDGGGRSATRNGTGGAGSGDGELGEEGEIGRGCAGRGGEPVRPFYRRGKVGSVKIFELQELRWPSMVVGEKYPGIDLGPASSRAARRCRS
jgi:hypothetical protein